MTETHLAYRALALQVACHAVNKCPDRASARARMASSIERIARHVRAAKGFLGPDVRLVVLPEYFLTGYPLGESIPEWADKAALAPEGPEYAALSRVAQDNGVFLSGNAYETDAGFPGLYFQASFVIDPAGQTVLRYRRLVSMFAPTPHDVWDRYLELYGLEGVFPVADTAIGRLAAIASEEILYPEIARALALRGAEVFVHSTSEVGSTRLTPKDVAKRARAIENLAYVVSANSGGFVDSDLAAHSTDGSVGSARTDQIRPNRNTGTLRCGVRPVRRRRWPARRATGRAARPARGPCSCTAACAGCSASHSAGRASCSPT